MHQDRSTSVKFEVQFKRTSDREPVSRCTNHITSVLRVFSSKKKSFRDIPVRATIYDLNPHAFPSKDSEQQRVYTVLRKKEGYMISYWIMVSL